MNPNNKKGGRNAQISKSNKGGKKVGFINV